MTFFKALKWVNDFRFNIQRGVSEKFSIESVSGYNGNLNALIEDVWPESAPSLVYPITAAQMDIASDNAADTSAGTGLRMVSIEGLDVNLLPLTEVVTLNGVTPVTTVNSFLRINKLVGLTAGSGETNAGRITIVNGANLQSSIEIGDGQSKGTHFTIPGDTTGYVLGGWFTSAKKDKGGRAEFRFRAPGGIFLCGPMFHFMNAAAIVTADHIPYIPLPPGTDCKIRAGETDAGEPEEISAGYSLILNKN